MRAEYVVCVCFVEFVLIARALLRVVVMKIVMMTHVVIFKTIRLHKRKIKLVPQ
jgi:hypothetical protein